MSEITTTPSGEAISNVPIENVMAGKHYDGSTGDMPASAVEIVRPAADAGGPYLESPDGLFRIQVDCDDMELRLMLISELRYFFNDPARSVGHLPKIKDALHREELANTTINK